MDGRKGANKLREGAMVGERMGWRSGLQGLGGKEGRSKNERGKEGE